MKTPQTLNEDECFLISDYLLLGYGDPKTKPKALRDHTMFLLMLYAGLRVGELVKLIVSDLIIKNEPVTNLMISREIAKRHHERTIPLTQRIRSNITEMDKHIWRKPGRSPQPWVFSVDSKSSHISTRQVERIIKRASMESIHRPIHPHVLRHTFASRLMRKTSMRVVQELLGHTNLSSTQVYTHPNGDDLKKAIEALPER